jgi:hypothetical protein
MASVRTTIRDTFEELTEERDLFNKLNKRFEDGTDLSEHQKRKGIKKMEPNIDTQVTDRAPLTDIQGSHT